MITLPINGETHELDDDPSTPLLLVLPVLLSVAAPGTPGTTS